MEMHQVYHMIHSSPNDLAFIYRICNSYSFYESIEKHPYYIETSDFLILEYLKEHVLHNSNRNDHIL